MGQIMGALFSMIGIIICLVGFAFVGEDANQAVGAIFLVGGILIILVSGLFYKISNLTDYGKIFHHKLIPEDFEDKPKSKKKPTGPVPVSPPSPKKGFSE